MDFRSHSLICLSAKKLFARILGAWILASLTLFCQLCRADTIYLKSGSKINGVVVSESANEVIIKMDQGMIAMDRAEIRRINKDPLSVLEMQERTNAGTGRKKGAGSTGDSTSRPGAVDKFIKSLAQIKSWIELKLGAPLTTPICMLFFVAILSLFLLLTVWRKNNRLLAENQELRERLLSSKERAG